MTLQLMWNAIEASIALSTATKGVKIRYLSLTRTDFANPASHMHDAE